MTFSLSGLRELQPAMVKAMVESMAKADGQTTITFEVADGTLKKIKGFYTAQSQGASGYFTGIEKGDG